MQSFSSGSLGQAHWADLIYHAGGMGKLILLALLVTSILCWSIIISKWKEVSFTLQENKKFMALFWSGKNMDDILSQSVKFSKCPLAVLFKNGAQELQKLSSLGVPVELRADNIHRVLLRTSMQEMAALEKSIHWLGTTASAAPFVGLFGTVWGIMNSFQSIGLTGAANLSVVAPGISEALITTAMGIGTAVPAAIFYNFFLGRLKGIEIEMDCFSQDFLNILQRSWSDRTGKSRGE